jgi:hypothetical protein
MQAEAEGRADLLERRQHQEKVLHVDMRFFLNMHVEKKSHVNMTCSLLYVDIQAFTRNMNGL